MGLLDAITGGSNKAAQRALNKAYDAYAGIKAPTAAELTLPELQKYVQAGILTPAQATAVLQKSNAYNDIKLDPSSMMAEQDALAKLKNLTDTGGMDDSMRAQLTEALDKIATDTRGTNAAITDQFAQRGIPTSLMAEAAMREEAGNAARGANLTATQAAGQAEQNAINAMLNQGNLASTMHGQNYQEEANKAAAENAMRQWNAGTQTNVNESNTGRQQAANLYNTQTAQNVSDVNTGNANQRTAYNAQVPETVFNNQMARAGGIAGVAGSQANQAMQQGQQQAGLFSGLLGAGTALAAGPIAGMGNKNSAAPAGYNPNYSYDMLPAAHGALVPGTASVPGDSSANDKVHALLSPGEVVIPRSIAPNPDAVKGFVQHLLKSKQPVTPHPDDVHSVLQALTKMRNGETQQVPTNNGPMTVKKGELRPPSLLDFPQNPNSKLITTGSTRG